MKKYDYFEIPTQVKFWEGNYYVGGIAYQDYIICGCCGLVIHINGIYESAPDTLEEDPIIVCNNWTDINSEICGDNN